VSDVLTREQRSYCMSCIRAVDTGPEVLVRKLLRSHGYRFRTHVKKLPGKPDIVLARSRKIIFVHGCFWHRHRCRFGRPTPQTRAKEWEEKFRQNRLRDQRARTALRRMGWGILVVWECQARRPDWLTPRLLTFLQS
jgi:DNA mismatch endonuclease (patch repair protein)